MNTYKCKLQLTNKTEWLNHISNVLTLTKDPNELLEKICNFDFKFDTILL